ncbi:MAG TPA: hypothetical protein VF591_12860 [Pyrinomonadaceae bacterium]
MSGAAPVFCSRCGAPGQSVESYCRSCGEWLPDPAAALTPRGRLRRLSPERKQRRMRVLELLSAAAAALAGVITFAVLSGADFELLIVPMVLCFVIVGWQMVAFFMGRSIQGRRDREEFEGGPTLQEPKARAQSALNAADTRDMVRPPSVTEHTTTLLDPVSVKKGEHR